MTCSSCAAIETQFGRRIAERDLRRYRRHGPGRTTRLLVHPPAAIESLVEQGGLVPCFRRATAFWQVAAWRRP